MKSFLNFYGSLKIKLPLLPAQHHSFFKIGLMGGSFNPVHDGHIWAANEAMRRLKLDQIWLLVTSGNPLKSSKELAPLQDRLKAVQKKIPNPRMKALSLEDELGTHFTSTVMCYLKGRCSRTKFVWIMGADNLASFHFWNNWRFIANYMPLLIIDRPHWRFKALSSPAGQTLARFRVKEERCIILWKRKCPAWVFFTNRLISHSSTNLRLRIQK